MAAPSDTSESWISRICRRIAELYITRVPFLSALTFALLCSEREKAGKPETLPREVIYLQFAVQFLSATMMSFGSQRSLFAVIAAAQTVVTSVVLHTSSAIHLPQWLMIRMISRDLAVVGAFLIIASRVPEKTTRRYKLAYLYPLGCSLVGVYMVAYSAQLYRDKSEGAAFMSHMPIAELLQPVYCVYLVCNGLLLASDNHDYMRTAAKMLIPGLVLVLLVVELDFNYWTRQYRMEFWNHTDQVLKMVTALCSLLLISL